MSPVRHRPQISDWKKIIEKYFNAIEKFEKNAPIGLALVCEYPRVSSVGS